MEVVITLFFAFTISIIAFFYHNFSKKQSSQGSLENNFRIWLAFIILIVFYLLALLFGWFAISKEVGALKKISDNFSNIRIILLCLSYLFVIFGTVIPVVIIFLNFLLPYKLFHSIIKKGVMAKAQNEIKDLRDILDICLKTAGVTKSIRLLVIDERIVKKLPGISNCAIVGDSQEDATLILTKDFVDFYKSGELNKEEVKAIFFHEISHIINNDHFFPLWIKNFCYTHAFSLGVLCLCLSFLFSALSLINTGFAIILGKDILLSFGLTVAFLFILRTINWQIIAQCMREREILADFLTRNSFVAPDTLISSIKKMALLSTKNNLNKFSLISFSTKDGNQNNMRGYLANIWQFILNVLKGKVEWHLSSLARIKYISNNIDPIHESETGLLTFKSIAISAVLLCIIFFFMHAIMWSATTEIGLFQVMCVNSMMGCVIISVLQFMPLRFLSGRMIQEKFIAPYSSSQVVILLYIPFSMLFNRRWHKIHRNNLIGPLIFALFTLTVWPQYALLFFFLYYLGSTVMALLFIVSVLVEKYKQEGLIVR